MRAGLQNRFKSKNHRKRTRKNLRYTGRDAGTPMHTSVAAVSAHVKISTSISTFGDVKDPNENTARKHPTTAAMIPRLKLPAMRSFSAKGLDNFQTTVQGRIAKKTSRTTVPTKRISGPVPLAQDKVTYQTVTRCSVYRLGINSQENTKKNGA